jgi:hypothetical protein
MSLKNAEIVKLDETHKVFKKSMEKLKKKIIMTIFHFLMGNKWLNQPAAHVFEILCLDIALIMNFSSNWP